MAQAWKHLLNFRCTRCGNCCRDPIVLVTDEDVRRIIEGTDQAACDVVDFYKPSEIEWGEDQPGWIRLKSGQRIMGLRRTESGCQYLGEDDLCTIYDYRPVTCRRYPFDLEFDENEDIELLSISQSTDCPYELDGYNPLGEIKAIAKWEAWEEEPYYAQVEAWNARKETGGKKTFLKFIGLE